jgi:hypothetical protein
VAQERPSVVRLAEKESRYQCCRAKNNKIMQAMIITAPVLSSKYNKTNVFEVQHYSASKIYLQYKTHQQQITLIRKKYFEVLATATYSCQQLKIANFFATTTN